MSSDRRSRRHGRYRLNGRVDRISVLAVAAGGLAALVLTSALGCNGQSARPKLLLYCGAGIRPPAAEIAEAFGRAHDLTVECDYAGSELLLSRIELSGVGDLYMPGDVHYVDQAKQEGLVTTSKTACYFIPVILVRKGNPKNIRSLADLTRPQIKVGLGDPKACAIGGKSSKIFAKNNISEEDVNVTFRSLTVNELGDKIKLRALDAVIVWDAVAAYFADSADAVPIPLEQNVVSTVAVGVLTSSKHPELAGKFLDFITSDEGRAIFQKHHYSLTLPE
jgi:molybdate transport system substrate-binding protein